MRPRRSSGAFDDPQPPGQDVERRVRDFPALPGRRRSDDTRGTGRARAARCPTAGGGGRDLGGSEKDRRALVHPSCHRPPCARLGTSADWLVLAWHPLTVTRSSTVFNRRHPSLREPCKGTPAAPILTRPRRGVACYMLNYSGRRTRSNSRSDPARPAVSDSKQWPLRRALQRPRTCPRAEYL